MEKGPEAKIIGGGDFSDINIITCHAFKDEQVLAVGPNTEDIFIYQVKGSELTKTHTLSKHTQKVTGLSWSCHGKLASCAEDRTAYVWEWDAASSSYKSVVVELRAPRAALCIAWAPNGTRFAVGLSSKDTAVCYYEPTVACWIALKVGKAKAAVGAVAWHSSSEYLATGSFDGRCAVYDVTEAKMLPPPGEKPFGDALITSDTGSWVNSVAFSPKGAFLAYLCQDSTVRVKEMSGGPDGPEAVVKWKGLPFLRGVFVGEKAIVAAGFDNVPVLIKQSSGQWQICGCVDVGGAPSAGLAAGSESQQAFADAKNKFGGAKSKSAASRHNNTITGLTTLRTNQFSTSGLDGQVFVWELPA